MNIIECEVCHNRYIVEEFSAHVCQKLAIVMFDTDGNRWGSYDRISLFPISPLPKLTDERLHDNEKDDNRRRLDRTIVRKTNSDTCLFRYFERRPVMYLQRLTLRQTGPIKYSSTTFDQILLLLR
jgi:hypothetical protein